MTGIFLHPLTVLYAKDPALPFIMDKSKALVSIHSFTTIDPKQVRKDRVGGIALLRRTGSVRVNGYRREGAGVIIHPKGIIVTNHHIVGQATQIMVTLDDGTQVPAKWIHSLPGTDIAFLSIRPPRKLSYVPLANSDTASVGTKVYIIGNALGHYRSVYGGKVSGLLGSAISRVPQPVFLKVNFGFRMFFGDSGSPLLNQKGYLIGLVSAGQRSGEKATLAVASNIIRDAYRQIPFGV